MDIVLHICKTVTRVLFNLVKNNDAISYIGGKFKRHTLASCFFSNVDIIIRKINPPWRLLPENRRINRK